MSSANGKKLQITPGDTETFQIALVNDDGTLPDLSTDTEIEVCFNVPGGTDQSITLTGGEISVLSSPNTHKISCTLSAVKSALLTKKSTDFDLIRTKSSGDIQSKVFDDAIEIIERAC